jgi:hypothetical protein
MINLSESSREFVQRLGLTPKKARVFGTDYLHLELSGKGDLYVTSWGLPILEHLLPDNWGDEEYYNRPENTDLRVNLEGSAHPYKITTKEVNGRTIDIVVKWCRVGSQVPLYATAKADFISEDDIVHARWNSPFEEFGLLMDLRQSNRYFKRKLLTQRPFAIYTPSEKLALWKTGREEWRMRWHHELLRKDQYGLPGEEAIQLDIHRIYALIYGWVKGKDAAHVFQELGLDEKELEEMTRQVYFEDMMNRGYRVLDTKPTHFIIRAKNGSPVRDRQNRIIYALVDFELLQRTEDYETRFHIAQRSRYWRFHRFKDRKAKTLPGGLHSMEILGVDYIYGSPSNQGNLFVIGNDPDLFEFYDPARWWTTPRIRLSPIVFRTRTIDSLHLVYRTSRVGMRPDQDPSSDQGRAIREFGYNSPFEEIAIAERLRENGVRTVFPRAVYRTAHESLPAEWLADDSRFKSHANLQTIDGNALLDRNHDYFTVWGFFRGDDPLKGYREKGRWGIIDIEEACDEGLLNERQYQELIDSVMERLTNTGFSETIKNDRFILHFENEELSRDEKGRFRVILCINGHRALEKGLLDLADYQELIAAKRDQLIRLGYEPLNLDGDQLLLSMDPDGILKRDETGNLEAILCNFELIRAPWMY